MKKPTPVVQWKVGDILGGLILSFVAIGFLAGSTLALAFWAISRYCF